MKILLVGNIAGASRSQLLIQRLIHFRTDKSYIIALCGSKTFTNELKRSGKFFKLFSRFLYLVDLFFKVAYSDVIYVMAMNNQFIKAVLFCNWFWKKPIISDLYISAYDTGLDRGYFKESTPKSEKLRRKLIAFDKLTLEKSDIVIHLTKGELDYIAHLVKAKLDYSRVRIIPLGIDERNAAVPSQSENFRLAWWGTWIPLHGIDKIMDCVKYIVESRPNVILNLYGVESPDKEVYIKHLNELGLSKNIFIHTDKSFANGHLQKELETSCDLVLGNFGDTVKATNVITNKIVDGLAFQLPVLTMDNNVIREFIDVENDLFVCTNDIPDMAKTIIYIMDNPEERKRRAINGHQTYERYFTPQKYTDMVVSIIEELAVKK